MTVNIWIETGREYYTYGEDKEDYFSNGYYKEVYLDAEDLAQILVDFYGVEEGDAIKLIEDFDLEDKIEEQYADIVQAIAEEKWRC